MGLNPLNILEGYFLIIGIGMLILYQGDTKSKIIKVMA
jgi:hypothetical protein